MSSTHAPELFPMPRISIFIIQGRDSSQILLSAAGLGRRIWVISIRLQGLRAAATGIALSLCLSWAGMLHGSCRAVREQVHEELSIRQRAVTVADFVLCWALTLRQQLGSVRRIL